MKLNTVMLDGRPRPVAVGEVNRHTSRLLGALADGERLVVTRHADPIAVVMTVRDAIEILVAPALDELAEAAERALAADLVIDPWPGAGPWRIVMPRVLEPEFTRLGGLDRGGLRRALRHGGADPERMLWLPTGKWLVPFSYPEDDMALVHALVETRDLEREVIGEEAWWARLRRDIDRHSHARTPWQRKSPHEADGVGG